MIRVDGALDVVPLAINTDSGSIAAGDGKNSPAVIQTLQTENGIVRVVFLTEYVDQICEGMLKAKEQANANTTSPPDLYIPKSDAEVSEVAKAHEQIMSNPSALDGRSP